MKRFLLSLGLVIVLSSLVIPSQAAASSIISLNFASGAASDYPMTSAMTAGVIPAANWNNLVGSTGSGTNLLDSTGITTIAAVTWTCDGCGQIWSFSGTDAIMETYLDYHDASITEAVTVSGLPANSSFDVYVYFDGSNPVSSRSAGYTIDSQTYWTTDVAGSDFDDTFIQASGVTEAAATDYGNYAIFSGLTGSEFTLFVTPSDLSDVPRGAVNGIQIVTTSVPEPGTVMLILTALVTLRFFRKLKK